MSGAFVRIGCLRTESRSLVHEILASAGDRHLTKQERRITLAPVSVPHRTRAAQSLCKLLEQTATVFPGNPAAPALRRAPAATHRARLPAHTRRPRHRRSFAHRLSYTARDELPRPGRGVIDRW